MIDLAMKRFIDGTICSDISRAMGVGISESHVRNLSNTALDIFSIIHDENASNIRKYMKS